MKLAGKIAIGVVVLGLIGAGCSEEDVKNEEVYEPAPTKIEQRVDEEQEVEQEEQEIEQEEVEERVPIEYEQALKKAQSYVRHQNFSKEGLKGQLEYHEFSSEAIQYAIENVDADWEQEARDHAESYMRHMSFSKQDLYDQLAYEGYTPEEIQQAVDYVFGE